MERVGFRLNKKLSRLSLFFSVAIQVCFISAAECQQEEIRSASPEDLSITVYNQNFGLVREQRNVELKAGVNFVRVEDVAARIDPTSVSFQSLTEPNSVVVREQNYQYDLIEPNTILSKSIGKNLKFKQYLQGGQTREWHGVLLSAPRSASSVAYGVVSGGQQGIVVKTADGVVLNPQGEIEVKELPEGLVGKPSLLWKLETTKPGLHKSEVSYQSEGLNWHCDYVAVLNDKDDHADLNSWVTIDNKSGASYKNASLKLLAGDVHKVTPQAPMAMDMAMAESAEGGAPAPQFKEQSFAEYHLYSLQGKTTVADNETKQMSLFNSAQIPVKKLYIYEASGNYFYNQYAGAENQKVNVKVEINNSEQNHLGMPLPKGKVRVYKKDQDGALQFVGEDQIDHTAKDEKIRLYIGDAFDLVGEHKQTNFQQISRRVQRASYEISLRNHKKEDLTITAVEHAGGDWTILNSSHPYKKKDSTTFEFAVKVPANGETKITYELETRY